MPCIGVCNKHHTWLFLYKYVFFVSVQEEVRDQVVKEDIQLAQHHNEENYEEEEEEEGGNGDKPPIRRAEMWGDWKEGQPIAATFGLGFPHHPLKHCAGRWLCWVVLMNRKSNFLPVCVTLKPRCTKTPNHLQSKHLLSAFTVRLSVISCKEHWISSV